MSDWLVIENQEYANAEFPISQFGLIACVAGLLCNLITWILEFYEQTGSWTEDELKKIAEESYGFNWLILK